MASDDQTTLVFTPTDVLTGPNTADEAVPADKRDAVLAAFAGKLPDQKLPFGVAPTSQGARGSDVIIEGITSGLTITLERVQPSMTRGELWRFSRRWRRPRSSAG